MLERLDNKIAHQWHVAINRFNHNRLGTDQWQHWMYEAKDLADEVPRMVMLFALEREGRLPKLHKQCSLAQPEEVIDNHLTCCLGVECRKCEYLVALEATEVSPNEIDTIKAWTCAAHILSKGGDVAKEGYLLTADDRMFWDRTYESLAASPEQPE